MWMLTSGVVITASSWVAAWGHLGLFGEYSFFPLWLGYILIINGLSELCYGTSLLTRMRHLFLLLFALSVPMWWFFERLNFFVQNWHYLMRPISPVHYFIQASIDFSTVIPAVLSTSFLFYRSLMAFGNSGTSRPIMIYWPWRAFSAALGLASFWLIPRFPHETFPLVWIAPILVLDPLAYALRLPCLLRALERGNRLFPVSVMAATFWTGLWWELWNFYSFPKWHYTIPYVGFWKIFEMPFLGYFGYPFFGLVIVSYAVPVLALIKIDIFDMFETARASRRRPYHEVEQDPGHRTPDNVQERL
jgi:hypothetical protein